MGETKPLSKTATKLRRIASLSQESDKQKFKWLMVHVNKESLLECFHNLDGNKAVGVDGIS